MAREDDPVIRCYRCGSHKPAENYAWRRKARGQRDSFCRPCRAAYKREHYAANKATYVARARSRKDELRLERTRFLLAYFETHPCVDCGEPDPIVLQFDHLSDKRFDIGHDLPDRRWADVLAEIAKCEVVCANCHVRRTSRRRGSVRVVLLAEREERETGFEPATFWVEARRSAN